MSYNEARGVTLDISASGRGLQQTLLLLAYLYANPKTVLLLDEPDAHLEILRQKQIYNLLSESAEETGSQLIAATHSEVLLNEAAQKDIVVAFVGSPHRVDNRGSQVLKSLREIGFDQYYQAEQTGWVLYLEGSTDLDILRTFAKTLEHPVAKYLSRPFTHYVANQPRQAESHYFGLQEAKNDLLGIAIFDRIEPFEPSFGNFIKLIWKKREIENYLCYKEILIKYATHGLGDDLLDRADKQIRAKAMEESIYEMENALKIQYKPGPWSSDIKASEDFLEPLFKNYFNRLGNYNLMGKTNFHQLARFIPKEMIDSEIIEKLDAIFKVAVNSKPLN